MLKEGDTFSSLFSQNKKHLDHHHHLTSRITMTCHLHHHHHNHKSDSECNKEETDTVPLSQTERLPSQQDGEENIFLAVHIWRENSSDNFEDKKFKFSRFNFII